MTVAVGRIVARGMAAMIISVVLETILVIATAGTIETAWRQSRWRCQRRFKISKSNFCETENLTNQPV